MELFSSNMATDNENYKSKPLHSHAHVGFKMIRLYQYHITKVF
jgi:hypothetical protein